MKIRKKIIWVIYIIFILTVIPSVLAAKEATFVSISLHSYEPSPVQPGQVMDFILLVDNLGGRTDDASLEIIEEYPFTLEHSQDIEEAKNLGSIGFSRRLQFRIRIADDAQDGITPLRVRYKDSNLKTGFREETFDINIETFDARLNILKVEQIPSEIVPGETGKLILTIENMDDRPLKNIDITLDVTNSFDMSTNMNNMISMQAMINARLEDVNRRIASGLSPLKGPTPMMVVKEDMETSQKSLRFSSFAIIDSSNQKNIKSMFSGEIVKVEFNVMALPDVQPNIYAIPVYLNYNDDDNSPFHVRADIPAIINDAPEIFVDIKSTNLRTTDFSSEVVFTVANRGLSELRYVTIEMAEDESITLLTAPRTIYIGNLAPGESKEGTYQILAEDEHIRFPINVEFRDSFNKEHQQKIELPFTIINRNYYRDLPYEMWIAWIILGVVVLVLTIFYVRQMAKKESE